MTTNKTLRKVKNIVFKNATYIIIGILMIFVALRMPLFYSLDNIVALASQIVVIGIAAIGMTMLILTGVTDISLGQQIYLGGVVSVQVYKITGSMPLSIVAAMLSCGIVGAINGVLIAKVGLPSMIATLSMQQVCNGAASLLIGAESVINVGPEFRRLGQDKLFGIPICVLIFLLLFALGVLLTNRTKFGRYIYAIGNNADALSASGIRVFRIRETIFVITGLLCGLAGVINASRIGGVQFGMGLQMEFQAIAAVVVGGTSMQGGRGNMIGTLLGIVVIGSIEQLMRLFNINIYLYDVVWGIIVLVTVGGDLLKQRELSLEKEYAAQDNARKHSLSEAGA